MYEGDHYECSVEDGKYADAMFQDEHSTDDDICENLKYDHDYSTNEHDESWLLNSERALDTLCLTGLRNRLSHGSLELQRSHIALDGSLVTLHRAVMDGKVEDITQSDLDVLRAVVSDYVYTVGRYNAANITEAWPQDDDLLVTITPKEIRLRLQMSNYELPTERITRSLKRLAGIIVQGNYRVRSATEAKAYPIHGSLFRLGINYTDSGKSVREYALLFDSDWGRAFMHNVRCGNFVKVRDIAYRNLDTGAKQLFYIAMIMPKRELSRTQDKLLQLMNIKEKQNSRRAIARLELYLMQLEGYGLITWVKEKGVYKIQRKYDPVCGYMSG